MKAFLTSIGENTTDLCKSQLEKFGFTVFLLDGKEPWIWKYEKFIRMADDDCMRIDADVILNRNILQVVRDIKPDDWITVCTTYDFYRNDIGTTCPTFYKKEALDIIKANIGKLHRSRPEASASRLPEVNPHKVISNVVVGIHGIAQDNESMQNAWKNKIDRKQIDTFHYDFDLAFQMRELCANVSSKMYGRKDT